MTSVEGRKLEYVLGTSGVQAFFHPSPVSASFPRCACCPVMTPGSQVPLIFLGWSVIHDRSGGGGATMAQLIIWDGGNGIICDCTCSEARVCMHMHRKVR